MPRTTIADIIARVQNQDRTAFIVDTSFVFTGRNGYLDVDFEGDLSEATEHVRKVSQFFKQSKTIVVPLEVREEINEGIRVFDSVYQSTRRHTGRPQPKSSHIREYMRALEEFNENSMGHDPRFLPSLNRIRGIDTESREYQDAWRHFYHHSYRTHLQKNADLSLADIAVGTLAYIIQRQGINACILTRDHDFELIARKTHASTRREDFSLNGGRLVRIYGDKYEMFIYRPE